MGGKGSGRRQAVKREEKREEKEAKEIVGGEIRTSPPGVRCDLSLESLLAFNCLPPSARRLLWRAFKDAAEAVYVVAAAGAAFGAARPVED